MAVIDKIDQMNQGYNPYQTQPLVIESKTGWVSLRLREVWEYRELLFFLTWRDIKVRYKQTLLGAAWAILQPLMTVIIFTLFFSRLSGTASDGVPYPLFTYVALVPWFFFANGLAHAATSLVENANLVKKIYFPRLIVPLSGVLAGLPDVLLSSLLLVGMMLMYQVVPPLSSLVWLPLFLLVALITALGVGIWLAALNVNYRDIRYVIPFLIQLWMFASPIPYSSSIVSDAWRSVYGLNPMVGVVEGFRWTLLGVGQPPGIMTLISAGVALVILVTGIAYFRRVEKTFADVV